MSEVSSKNYDWNIIAEALHLARKTNSTLFEDMINDFVSEKEDMDYKNTLYKAILIVLKDLKE
ncbi:MAG: hypothetical protein ACE5J9_04585, partial [Methanosarcinales archaeon]